MYLKSIEVQGFKSFANKIKFEFHNGITGIVGPNGSGKSNVADAVRWVLGEQRVKQLRGGNMQDVIFSGTENRKPLSYASVAITLDNADHKLPIEYDEVTVSRRLYRSGESEYKINGTSCRLKDINELFYDTGIGKEGYSIIGQGQIDQILSGRPEERRELFDEAAGIVKFKRRKAIAQKKLEDENVYRKMQGHWIIEMSEMIATANAKSIEEIKSFLSRQKETYKIPYETHPADRKRQCVFGGSSNTLDFLPLDRTGNRRFVPVMVYPERAEVHILADEQASREYINQMWAEAMEIYRSGNFRLRFSPAMNAYLKAHQKDFMPEDTKAGQILDYLERYSGSIVCSKQLYKEALGHDYDEPKQWELREINDIMNNAVTGWRAFSNPRYFPEPYRRQKGWERIRNDNEPDNSMDGFQEIPTEEMEQLGLPEEWLKQK